MSEAKRRKLDAILPEDWQSIAARRQQRVLDSIPEKWRIPSEVKAKHTGDARSFAIDCGILTPHQIEITELNATQLLKRIHSGDLTSVEATEAFCARAAIAHQLVNCLTEFTPDDAMARAKLYDDEFAATGKLVGPLHGMPMAVKDIMHVKDSVVTMAWVAWADNVPSTFDSSPARVMRDAGAVFFGRT